MTIRPFSLPLSADFTCTEDYVDSLLTFITSSLLFQYLCGGVHILDFLTQEPDLYSSVLPTEWREWFQRFEVSDTLDLLLREDLSEFASDSALNQSHMPNAQRTWRYGPCPPATLVEYIRTVRKHGLDRSYNYQHNERVAPPREAHKMPRHVAVGMKPKKVHEVENIAMYINDLAAQVDGCGLHKITHIVDFGSGQNYLGRALASHPYQKNIIALESKRLNIRGAKAMDVTAKLTAKEIVMRNKKQYRAGLAEGKQASNAVRLQCHVQDAEESPTIPSLQKQEVTSSGEQGNIDGNLQYVETVIENGDLSNVINQIPPVPLARNPALMVVSLHSCGNLLHHGLRSLILNPTVKVVAMVGCCYNLITERLGPPTYKLPSLRSANLRLDKTTCTNDPHGFPMSDRFATYEHQYGRGIRLNITARMMAVQAPGNWTATDCESFFTRHFFRALLQRILVDYGFVEKPGPMEDSNGHASPRGWTGAGPVLTIGSLRKPCYASFKAYVRGAIAKLEETHESGAKIGKLMASLTDADIDLYEEKYKAKKKELSVIWSLMAFSASVVESAIVIDRWLYLKEQEEVKDCWVEAAFDYQQSPRNLIVVGIKHAWKG